MQPETPYQSELGEVCVPMVKERPILQLVEPTDRVITVAIARYWLAVLPIWRLTPRHRNRGRLPFCSDGGE
jgi:hypothetical protein